MNDLIYQGWLADIGTKKANAPLNELCKSFNVENVIVSLQFDEMTVCFVCLCFYRHFLFKTGTGTTPFFGAAAPGYTMATGTVYSTPARPLPRNTLSRGAFKFKKSPKHCSWKCTALIAVAIAVVLSIILCYCVGKTPSRPRQLRSEIFGV